MGNKPLTQIQKDKAMIATEMEFDADEDRVAGT